MQFNKKLDIETYTKLKITAYRLAKILKGDKDKILQAIEEFSIKIKNPEATTIYISTLLYPNDLDIIPIVSESQDIETIIKQLNIPKKIFQLKAREYVNYNLLRLLKQNDTLNELCRDQSNLSNNETIDEIINSKLK